MFTGNNRQQMPLCTKTISSLVRKFLSIVNAHMSLGTVWGTVASAALVASISLVSTLQAGEWARVSTPTRNYFQHIPIANQLEDVVQCGVLCLVCRHLV